MNSVVPSYFPIVLACDAKDMSMAPTKLVPSATARKKEGMACALTPESPTLRNATIARASTCTANVFDSEVTSNQKAAQQSECATVSVHDGDAPREPRCILLFNTRSYRGFSRLCFRRGRLFCVWSLRNTEFLLHPHTRACGLRVFVCNKDAILH